MCHFLAATKLDAACGQPTQAMCKVAIIPVAGHTCRSAIRRRQTVLLPHPGEVERAASMWMRVDASAPRGANWRALSTRMGQLGTPSFHFSSCQHGRGRAQSSGRFQMGDLEAAHKATAFGSQSACIRPQYRASRHWPVSVKTPKGMPVVGCVAAEERKGTNFRKAAAQDLQGATHQRAEREACAAGQPMPHPI